MTLFLKSFSKILTILEVLLGWVIYPFSFLVPRSNKIWIFIGCRKNKERELFSDNSKYMFLYASQNISGIEAVWIGRDNKLPKIIRGLGYKAFYIYSPMGLYYSLRAGYTFVDAFVQFRNWKFSGGTKVVQLWHGKGMKKTAHESPYSLPAASRFISPNLFRNYEYVTATSEYSAGMMSTVFRIPMEKVLITGLPRHDAMFTKIRGAEIDGVPSLEKKVKSLKKNGVHKIVFYAPTFRPNATNPLFENLKKGTDKFQLDLKMLNDLFEKNNTHLFISLHPKFSLLDYGARGFKNITFLRPGFDIYPTLPLFDMLITDYSSLFSDFLLLDRPMLFLVYDLEKYKVEMGLFEDFDKMTPGPKVFTNEQLALEMEKILKGIDAHREHRLEVRSIFYKKIDGNSAQRTAEAIKKHAGINS